MRAYFFIQDTHFPLNLILFNMYKRNFQHTQSYAFLKSTLNTKHFFSLLLASSIVSFATKTVSNIFLLPTKALCLPLIILGITHFNLLTRTFEMILYRLPTKEIGLKSLNPIRSSLLGARAIQEEFIPFGITPFS